nr:MAG TPA: hypothetical protein [Caudoviricetes sp.]
MKYDFSECNNLQFQAKWDEEKVITGYLKVAKEGEECVGYVFSDWKESESLDSSLQIVTRNYERCEIIEEFSEWAEKHDLEIVPRDPETYTDWKVGDRVMDKDTGGISTIAAKLGDIVFLLNDNNAVTSTCTARLTKYYTLVLTDYEQELIHAEQEKKKECPFKEGDKVLVRDSDTSWKFDVFQNYEENACYSYECLGSEYEQCIPLNEHTWKLLGTTDEYKEEE